jgi:Icc-related predicted phosphoesterase
MIPEKKSGRDPPNYHLTNDNRFLLLEDEPSESTTVVALLPRDLTAKFWYAITKKKLQLLLSNDRTVLPETWLKRFIALLVQVSTSGSTLDSCYVLKILEMCLFLCKSLTKPLDVGDLKLLPDQNFWFYSVSQAIDYHNRCSQRSDYTTILLSSPSLPYVSYMESLRMDGFLAPILFDHRWATERQYLSDVYQRLKYALLRGHFGTYLTVLIAKGLDPNLLLCNITEPQALRLAEWGWRPTDKLATVSVLEEVCKYYVPKVWGSWPTLKFPPVVVSSPTVLVSSGIKIVCFSDTHNTHQHFVLEPCDIACFTGDACVRNGKESSILAFIEWFGQQKATHKVMIPGNHDGPLVDPSERIRAALKRYQVTCLRDEECTIMGIKFYGSPWIPHRPRHRCSSFVVPRSQLIKKWNAIPSDTQILLTHYPPYRIGDLNSLYYTSRENEGGCVALFNTITYRLNLRYHIFGHVHAGYGIYHVQTNTKSFFCVNAAVYDDKKPITIYY